MVYQEQKEQDWREQAAALQKRLDYYEQEKKVQIFILNNCASYSWHFGNKAGAKVFTCAAARFL